MKYIVVNEKNLTVDVVDDYPESEFFVPTELKPLHRKLSPLERVVYYDFLYPARYEEDKITYPGLKKKRVHIKYKLIEPPPWMIAMAYIMWEAIMQGLTWAAVKALVWSAMAKLASFGVAPARTKAEMKTHVNFPWARYGTDEKKQRDLFIGLRRIYMKMSERGRRDVANSVITENS